MRDSYPPDASSRDRFVVERRGVRAAHDPWRRQGVIVEDERGEDGASARVATVFLTGRECPWRCVMCDLWRYTIEEDTPAGAIPAQIAAAWEGIRAADSSSKVSAMKLYNAGSFFDPRAVPESDYDAIAAQVAGLERVIVESHPALIGARVDRFLGALAAQSEANRARSEAERTGVARVRSEGARFDSGQSGVSTRSEAAAPRLEVAMGLETAHPEALEKLHKRITLERFARAADDLRARDVALRVFLLISPPFIPADEQDAWLMRSIEFAFDCGASVASLVPTRAGNGAMEALASEGLFRPPTMNEIERSFASALALGRARGRRVFVDLWELERFADSSIDGDDFIARQSRLASMNLEQRRLGLLADASVDVAS
jgi:archaeosine synthase beta-subunit